MPSERRKGTCGHLPLNVRSKAGRMKSVNLGRMIRLAGEVFSARTDPDQLDVDEAVIERLQSLHPATLSEHVEGDGPVVWILLIPTTRETMDLFLITRLENANYWTGLILANTLTPYTCVRLWCYRSSEEKAWRSRCRSPLSGPFDGTMRFGGCMSGPSAREETFWQSESLRWWG